jgi:hypothetical protein
LKRKKSKKFSLDNIDHLGYPCLFIHLGFARILSCVCFRKTGFWETTFQLFCVCLPLEKLVNGKHFPVKEKFGLVSRKVFSFYFGRKTLSGSCENFRNVILFADYIKFGPQTFDCYIYFVLNIFFSISSLKI